MSALSEVFAAGLRPKTELKGGEEVLLCFPYAGAGEQAFHSWPTHLAGLGVVVFEPPGRGRRFTEKTVSDMETLIDPLLDAVAPLRIKALFGHSMGALIAHAVATRLDSAPLLFTAACTPPDARFPTMTDLDDDGFLGALAQFGGLPEALTKHPELRSLFIPVLRADLRLVENYRAQGDFGRLRGRIVGVGGAHDPMGRADELAGWSRFTEAQFSQYTIDSGHFFLDRSELLDLITSELGS